jgi:anti-sigma B factor antagonist
VGILPYSTIRQGVNRECCPADRLLIHAATDVSKAADSGHTSRVFVIAASGPIDLATSRTLSGRLGEAAGQAGETVVLDLSGVTFMDSTGLGVVMKAHSRLHRQGRRFVVVAPPGPVLDLLELTSVRDELLVVGSREEAEERVAAFET